MLAPSLLIGTRRRGGDHVLGGVRTLCCGVAGLRGSFPAPNRGEAPPAKGGAPGGERPTRKPATPQPRNLITETPMVLATRD